MYNSLNEAYNHGYSSGYYTFSYLNPYYTKEELKKWEEGFMQGKKDRENFAKNNQEESKDETEIKKILS